MLSKKIGLLMLLALFFIIDIGIFIPAVISTSQLPLYIIVCILIFNLMLCIELPFQVTKWLLKLRAYK